MTALHVFDMDGTLLGSSASQELAHQLGTSAQVAQLEAQLAAGQIITRDFASAICGQWRGLTPEAVAAAFTAGTVAVNADHHLAGLAAADYRGQDLAGAYRLGRDLLSADGG